MTDAGGETYDVIVVGLGAMGAAVAYHAAKLGLSVMGIDRFDPPHALGSTHAETRITRLAVGEGAHYLPFVERSHQIWQELHDASGERLLYQTGGVLVTGQQPVAGQRWEDFVVVTDAIAQAAGIDFDILTPAELRVSHPMILVPDDVRVGFEPTGGLVMAERAVAVQLQQARELGAALQMNREVSSIRPLGNGVEVVSQAGIHRASHVVLATGPWFGDLVAPELAALITVTRQVVYWFEVEDFDAFRTDRFPFLMWIDERDEDYVGVFPIPPGTTPALKVLGEQFLQTTDPASVDRVVSTEEIEDFYHRLLLPKVAGVTPNCVKTAVCLYSNTPDDHFLIDSDPRSDRITVMSPCSGHGFKHSTALGEAVAQSIAVGDSDLDLSPFRRRS